MLISYKWSVYSCTAIAFIAKQSCVCARVARRPWAPRTVLGFAIKTHYVLDSWKTSCCPWIHGRNLVGDTGDGSPPLFQTGGHNMPCPPTFFLFRFCNWIGFKNKSDVLCEELFMLDGRPHIAKLMLKQSLVWYLWFRLIINFSFDKIIFSSFQDSRDRERYLTVSVRDFTLCGILLERLFSCNSESITAAHVRDHRTAMICSVQKCNCSDLFRAEMFCCNVGCHVFRNRQHII